MDCSICINKLYKNYIMLQCGHKFHSKCIQKWENMLINQEKPLTCPHCRIEYDHIAYNIRNNIRYRNKKILSELEKKICEINSIQLFYNNKLDWTPKINKVIELFKIVNKNYMFLKTLNALKESIQNKAFEFIEIIHNIRQLNWDLKTKVTGILHETLSLYN